MAGIIGGAVVAEPIAGAAAGAVTVARVRWRRARLARLEEQRADADVAVLADLLVLGLTAGLSLRAAIAAGAPHVHHDLRSELDDLVASIDRRGMAAGLAAARGRLEGLARVAAGAAVSGAPLGSAITAFARTRRHEDHAARMAAARRLPVRLLLPLALLILPGFVILAVGPAVLEGLARLGPTP
ncbi:MAG TPA: type II secretion system F family protein [Acidimicrobiia bacterium]|nr:type II secretion system F family protein [Acidimicrobiia bacterium]